MASSQHLSVLVTHPQSRLATYFGEQALRSLREIADVRLNTSDEDLAGPSLIDAASSSPQRHRACAGALQPVRSSSCSNKRL